MSGWDEGAVFYSNQSFPEGERGQDVGVGELTRHKALVLLRDFINNFEDPKCNNRRIYK